MKNIDKVFEVFVGNDIQTRKEVQEKCPDVNKHTVWSSMVGLLKKGKIIRVTTGKYRRI